MTTNEYQTYFDAYKRLYAIRDYLRAEQSLRSAIEVCECREALPYLAQLHEDVCARCAVSPVARFFRGLRHSKVTPV